MNNSVQESSIVVIPAHSSMNLIQKSADDSEKVWESIKNRTVCQMGRDCNGFTVFGGRGRGRIPQPVAETRSPVLSGPLQAQTREISFYERKCQEIIELHFIVIVPNSK